MGPTAPERVPQDITEWYYYWCTATFPVAYLFVGDCKKATRKKVSPRNSQWDDNAKNLYVPL